ncbi:hypothetical protein WPG_2161 [Winogradskyella sp. PG-2]|nr:hypothetical protein WPG_2161 [Winogradskyella sp. PG-2]
MTDRKHFFENFIEKINKFESFKKAKTSSELIIINENNKQSDITAYLTTWEKGELAENHEGEQLGIYLKKINGELKFAGIETIP